MGPFGGLTPADAQDIKSLPPIPHAIDDACMLPPM
jgi:hypothetical protein